MLQLYLHYTQIGKTIKQLVLTRTKKGEEVLHDFGVSFGSLSWQLTTGSGGGGWGKGRVKNLRFDGRKYVFVGVLKLSAHYQAFRSSCLTASYKRYTHLYWYSLYLFKKVTLMIAKVVFNITIRDNILFPIFLLRQDSHKKNKNKNRCACVWQFDKNNNENNNWYKQSKEYLPPFICHLRTWVNYKQKHYSELSTKYNGE